MGKPDQGAAAAGTYYYGACVDAVADESDTTNNCSPSVQVTVPVATQACSADAETWRGLKVCDERPRDGLQQLGGRDHRGVAAHDEGERAGLHPLLVPRV